LSLGTTWGELAIKCQESVLFVWEALYEIYNIAFDTRNEILWDFPQTVGKIRNISLK
jgi:hypothetical protein